MQGTAKATLTRSERHDSGATPASRRLYAPKSFLASGAFARAVVDASVKETDPSTMHHVGLSLMLQILIVDSRHVAIGRLI